MLAIVEAEMSIRLRAPRFSRSADSGAFVSENGTCAASLICSLPQGGWLGSFCADLERIMRGTGVDGQPSPLVSHMVSSRMSLDTASYCIGVGKRFPS